MESTKKLDFEKIGVYLACLGYLFVFWQSQEKVYDKIADLKERISVLETKIEMEHTNKFPQNNILLK